MSCDIAGKYSDPAISGTAMMHNVLSREYAHRTDTPDDNFLYDTLNRLTQADYIDLESQANGYNREIFEYDAIGNRLTLTAKGGTDTTTYLYGGANELTKVGNDEQIIMIDVTDSNAVYYYHFDGLGSVAALSNENNEIVERYSYDVFGEPNRVSDVNNPYMFTGRRFDEETELYYYRARYYAPDIGRFLQTDSVGYLEGLKQCRKRDNAIDEKVSPSYLKSLWVEKARQISMGE